MRILITTDAVGGVWDHATTLYRRLAERGHDAFLAVLGHPPVERMGGLPVGARWAARSFALEWAERGLHDIEPAARWIASLADAMEADVVHLNQLAYAHRIERPTVVAVHSDAWSWFSEVRGAAPREDPRWRAYHAAVVRGLEAADAVVAPSQYQADLTLRHYGRAVDRVVRNGIDRSQLAEAHRAPNGATSSPRRLVTLGRAWDEAKGHGTVDEALGLVREPWAAYLAGDLEGPEGQRLHARRLKYLGSLPIRDTRELLRRTSVYVGASIYEPFGLAPVEAAMAGCALVLSDIGSFRELWGSDALYFPPRDAACLASTLDRLHGDDLLHHQMRLRAMRRAWACFDDRRMTSEYTEIYKDLRRRHGVARAVAPDAQVRPGGGAFSSGHPRRGAAR